jgi:predicted esterase
MKTTGETSVKVVTHGTGSSVFGYALGKFEESTLSFYSNFKYQFAISKVVAIAPCPISQFGKPTDNDLMKSCDKVPWYVLVGQKDDICPLVNVETFIKGPLTATKKLPVYTVYPDVGHRLRKFEPLIATTLPSLLQ